MGPCQSTLRSLGSVALPLGGPHGLLKQPCLRRLLRDGVRSLGKPRLNARDQCAPLPALPSVLQLQCALRQDHGCLLLRVPRHLEKGIDVEVLPLEGAEELIGLGCPWASAWADFVRAKFSPSHLVRVAREARVKRLVQLRLRRLDRASAILESAERLEAVGGERLPFHLAE